MTSGSFHPVIHASLWMTGTLFSFAAMAVAGRQLSTDLTTFQILFFRSLVGLAIIGILAIKTGRATLATKNFSLHLARNIAHFGGQFGWFYGIAYISLAEVFAIEFTLPVWTAVLAVILLKERITRPRVAAICMGLVGMLIILRPGMGVMSTASLAVLIGAVCYALSHTLTKKITLTDTPLSILFYMTMIQLPMGLVLSLNQWQTPGPRLYFWIFLVGITALSGHYCMARALKVAPATVVVPLDFLRLPLIAFVGFLFYNEPLDVFVFAGGLIMLTGNFINIRAEQKTVG